MSINGNDKKLFAENLEDNSYSEEELAQISDEENSDVAEEIMDFEDLTNADNGESEEDKPADGNEMIWRLQQELAQLKAEVQEKDKQYKGLQKQTTSKLQDYSGLRIKHENLSRETQELRERIKAFESNVPGGGYMTPDKQVELQRKLEDGGMSPEIAELKAQLVAMNHNNQVKEYESEYKNLRAQEASMINMEMLRELKEHPVYGQPDIIQRGQDMFNTYTNSPNNLNLHKLFAMAALAEKYEPDIEKTLKEEQVEEYTRSGGYERPRPKVRPLPVPSTRSTKPEFGGNREKRVPVRMGTEIAMARSLNMEDLADEILNNSHRR